MPSRYRSFPSVYDHFGLFWAIFGDFFGHFERSQTNLTGRQGEPILSPSLKYPGDSISSHLRPFSIVYDRFGLFWAIFDGFFASCERSQTNMTGRQGEPMLGPSLRQPGDSIPSHLRSSPIVYDRFRLFWAIFGSFFGYFERSQTNMEGPIDEPILGPRLR